jgi:hypothetical protein
MWAYLAGCSFAAAQGAAAPVHCHRSTPCPPPAAMHSCGGRPPAQPTWQVQHLDLGAPVPDDAWDTRERGELVGGSLQQQPQQCQGVSWSHHQQQHASAGAGDADMCVGRSNAGPQLAGLLDDSDDAPVAYNACYSDAASASSCGGPLHETVFVCCSLRLLLLLLLLLLPCSTPCGACGSQCASFSHKLSILSLVVPAAGCCC